VALSEDYAFLIGSAGYSDADGDLESGSTFRWLVEGEEMLADEVAEHLMLHLDGSLDGAGGEAPSASTGAGFAPGRWGSALELADGGVLSYPRAGNLDLDAGTVEMWVALTEDGDAPVYAERWHCLLLYIAPDDDWMGVVQSESGVLYAGGGVDGEWQSAWSVLASTRGWRAGEWHHLVYTYSEADGFMRFYLDGVLVADTNEGHYWAVSDGGDELFIGGDPWGAVAHYRIDEVRLSGRAAAANEIAARARRRDQPADNEVWLDASLIEAGDHVVFELTPASASEVGTPCSTAPLVFTGIPLLEPRPPSTLLPPGTRELELTVLSSAATSCSWSLGEPLPLQSMQAFDQGAGTTEHRTVIRGLDPDPAVINRVFLRSAAQPDFLLRLDYRCLAAVNPSFPRTGNLWGYWNFYDSEPAKKARIDLWLGADMAPEEMEQLRALNPNILILTSINAVENGGLPEDYYLKDVDGDRVEVWPGSYRLNLTKSSVAEYQARFAYERVLSSGLLVDGCFFDNVMTTQSWLTHDIYGNPFHPDADEDGQPDDLAEFDAAWKAGVFHEMETFRELMPGAIVTGHSMHIAEPGIAGMFNGISLGFFTADTLEGRMSFHDLWALYSAWNTLALPPRVNMFESSPPDQIAYGYDYAPWDKIPPSTLEFARTYFPYVRFGLALTLMGDGYFAHEFGDTWHGNDWWYDELDFDLGHPFGPAEAIVLGSPGDELMDDGGFEDASSTAWSLWFNADAGCAGTGARDLDQSMEGEASVRVEVAATSGVDWHVELAQYDRSLEQGTTYELIFWARADAPRPITLSSQKGSPDWDSYGLWRRVALSTGWEEHQVPFVATATADDARIQFMLGETTGTVWLDHVRLRERPPEVLARSFTNGLVLLNPAREKREVDLGLGYRRLQGDQAPRHEWIVDDSDQVFSTTGEWVDENLDSGEWQAAGPFFHDWGEGCRSSVGVGGEARWELAVPEADTYTITAWWPAAPSADQWSGNAEYELVAGGSVVASATLDQRQSGDEWHVVAEAALAAQDAPYLRLISGDGDPVIADALHVRSAARYNDGSFVTAVSLAPMDGIVLEWIGPGRHGDVNRDDVVDAFDLLEVVKAVYGGFSPYRVDVSGDGVVDATDVGEVLTSAS